MGQDHKGFDALHKEIFHLIHLFGGITGGGNDHFIAGVFGFDGFLCLIGPVNHTTGPTVIGGRNGNTDFGFLFSLTAAGEQRTAKNGSRRKETCTEHGYHTFRLLHNGVIAVVQSHGMVLVCRGTVAGIVHCIVVQILHLVSGGTSIQEEHIGSTPVSHNDCTIRLGIGGSRTDIQ